jgi:hypothetical protein
MMMTYIRMRPWVSNRMKSVIVQVSRSYRLLFCGVITYMNYTSACTNYVTITLWEGILGSVWCCHLSPIVCVCAREGMSNIIASLLYCITTLGGRHCIVGFQWIEHWWLLGTHHATRSCWQGHDLFSRSSITMIWLMLISSIIFTVGFLF